MSIRTLFLGNFPRGRLAVGFLITLSAMYDQPAMAQSPALVGDGKTDNTAALVALFGNGKRTVTIPPGDYVTGSVSIPGDIHIVLSPGVTLRDSGRLRPHDQLLRILSDNVRIVADGAHVVANRKTYDSGEQRHGVLIYGAHNVTISGLDSSGHSGDGFYIGGPPGNPSANIVLENVVADNNRRQGLSITSARNVRVVDSTFSNTNGTSPQYGIDIEPNGPGDAISGIKLRRIHTVRNVGGGVMIELSRLRGTSNKVSIDVDGHESTGDGTTLAVQSIPRLQGLVRYANARSKGAANAGVMLLDPYADGLRTELSDVQIVDNNASGNPDPASAAAIVVRRRGGEREQTAFGNVSLNRVGVSATDGSNRSPLGFWIQGQHSASAPANGRPWNGLSVRDVIVHGKPVNDN
jgi:Right handed beta helix region